MVGGRETVSVCDFERMRVLRKKWEEKMMSLGDEWPIIGLVLVLSSIGNREVLSWTGF